MLGSSRSLIQGLSHTERMKVPGLPESEIFGVLTINADSWGLPRSSELERRVKVCILNKHPPPTHTHK